MTLYGSMFLATVAPAASSASSDDHAGLLLFALALLAAGGIAANYKRKDRRWGEIETTTTVKPWIVSLLVGSGLIVLLAWIGSMAGSDPKPDRPPPPTAQPVKFEWKP